MVNDIEVTLPKLHGEQTDVDIAEAAVRALEWDSAVPKDKIRVTVSKGWVTREGEVEWRLQKDVPESAVRRILGVSGVTNLITIKPSETPSDVKKRSSKRWCAAGRSMSAG